MRQAPMKIILALVLRGALTGTPPDSGGIGYYASSEWVNELAGELGGSTNRLFGELVENAIPTEQTSLF